MILYSIFHFWLIKTEIKKKRKSADLREKCMPVNQFRYWKRVLKLASPLQKECLKP